VLEHINHAFRSRDAYFCATHAGAELDLMVTIAGKRYGFECKYTDAPGRKRSMNIAIEDLRLEHLCVIYPGNHKYALDDKITAIPLEEISQLAETWATN
jgi:predicted AAA+ superfamily ATPase